MFNVPGRSRRHRKFLCDNISKVTAKQCRQLAHRGGIQAVTEVVYVETRNVLVEILSSICRDSCTRAEHARRDRVNLMDVIYGLKRASEGLHGKHLLDGTNVYTTPPIYRNVPPWSRPKPSKFRLGSESPSLSREGLEGVEYTVE